MRALVLIFCFGLFSESGQTMEAQEVDALRSSGIRIVTLMRNLNATRKYPDALPSLLKTMNEETSTRFDTDPLFISELT
ncbi:MAG: hypothetical protein VYA10_12775, partial [Verrucomicrobiota bacterium]|nr:hypothetical protein [Verrucomicrobiota bacterium]